MPRKSLPYPEGKPYLSKEDALKIAAIDCLDAHDEGSSDDHYFRRTVVDAAEWHINEIEWEGQEFADERLPAKVKQMICYTYPISQEDAMAVVLRHITYLQAQAKTTAFLNKLFSGEAA